MTTETHWVFEPRSGTIFSSGLINLPENARGSSGVVSRVQPRTATRIKLSWSVETGHWLWSRGKKSPECSEPERRVRVRVHGSGWHLISEAYADHQQVGLGRVTVVRLLGWESRREWELWLDSVLLSSIHFLSWRKGPVPFGGIVHVQS